MDTGFAEPARSAPEAPTVSSRVWPQMPAVCINLERRPDRKQNALGLAKELGLQDMRIITAVDGQQLLKSGGRAYQASNANGCPKFLMLWDDAGRSEQHACCGGRGAKNGTADIWALLGCTLSHEVALKALADMMDSSDCDAGLVLEDDTCIRAGLSAEDLNGQVRGIINTLDTRFPNWALLQLNGKPVDRWAKRTRNGMVFDDVGVSEKVYLSNAYIIRRHAVDSLLVKLKSGMTADGALVSFQGDCIRAGTPQATFWTNPPVLIQNKALGREIATTTPRKG